MAQLTLQKIWGHLEKDIRRMNQRILWYARSPSICQISKWHWSVPLPIGLHNGGGGKDDGDWRRWRRIWTRRPSGGESGDGLVERCGGENFVTRPKFWPQEFVWGDQIWREWQCPGKRWLCPGWWSSSIGAQSNNDCMLPKSWKWYLFSDAEWYYCCSIFDTRSDLMKIFDTSFGSIKDFGRDVRVRAGLGKYSPWMPRTKFPSQAHKKAPGWSHTIFLSQNVSSKASCWADLHLDLHWFQFAIRSLTFKITPNRHGGGGTGGHFWEVNLDSQEHFNLLLKE